MQSLGFRLLDNRLVVAVKLDVWVQGVRFRVQGVRFRV
jgi:hypothetical protein